MPILQVSKKIFQHIVKDVGNIETLFECSEIDCDLSSDRLIISAKSYSDKTPVKINHIYYSGWIPVDDLVRKKEERRGVIERLAIASLLFI